MTLAREGGPFWDENPSWSPDGTRLVIARTYPPDVAVDLKLPPDVGYQATEILTVTVSNAEEAGSAGPFRVNLVAGSDEGSGRVEFAETALPDGCIRDTATTVHCSVGGLAPGKSVSFELTIIGTSGGDASVTATVPPLPAEVETTNNTSTDTTPVQPPSPEVAVTIAVPDTFFVSERRTATITLTNNQPGSSTGEFTLRLIATAAESGPEPVEFPDGGFPEGCAYDDAQRAHCDVADLLNGSPRTFVVPIFGAAAGGVHHPRRGGPLPARGDDRQQLGER